MKSYLKSKKLSVKDFISVKTYKRYRCAFQIFNQFHLVGGGDQYDKSHFVLDSDQLVRKPDLSFTFNDGLCYGTSAKGFKISLTAYSGFRYFSILLKITLCSVLQMGILRLVGCMMALLKKLNPLLMIIG